MRDSSSRPLIAAARRWAGALLMAAVAPLQAGPTAAPTTLPSAGRGPDAAEAYARLVARLAADDMEGRGPHTRGLAKARDFLVARLRGLGLKPAFGDSYTQAFRVRTGAEVARRRLEIVRPGAPEGERVAKADAGREFLPLGFSASGEFDGEAVFVGYGIVSRSRKYDSYAGGKDVAKGRVVIAYRFEPQDAKGRSLWGRSWTRDASLLAKARWAAQRGAVALLVVNPPSQASAEPPGGGRSLAAYGVRTKLPMLYVSGGLLRRVLAAAGRDEPAAAMRKLQSDADGRRGGPVVLKGVRLRGAVKLKPVYTTLHNVAGALEGAGRLAREALIVGAHYDHVGYGDFGSRYRGRRQVHPGADDNASGTAGVLMLARRFTHRAAGDALAPPPASRRKLVFACFGGEELGLWGSRHMAGHLDEMRLEPGRAAAMVNMDMIGRLRDKRLTVWGVDSGDRLREIVKAAAAGSGLDLRLVGGGVGPSDNASFYRRRIPVLNFFTGAHADYHTPRDTAEKINAPGAIEVLAVVDGVLQGLWGDPEPVAWRPPKASDARSAMAAGAGAYLGIVPDLGADAEGCVVGEVVPDAPAAKAGLAAGDLIVAFDDKPVTCPEEIMVALHGARPGQEVTLKVRRGKKTLELKATLVRR